MNTPEMIAALKAGNGDVIMVRVGGSSRLAFLSDEAQGKLNWVEREELLKEFVEAANRRAVEE